MGPKPPKPSKRERRLAKAAELKEQQARREKAQTDSDNLAEDRAWSEGRRGFFSLLTNGFRGFL
jgi:hypothetical protein